MAQPTVTDVHQDAILSQLSLAYRNNDYIGRDILPEVLVAKASDKYYEFNKPAWFRDEAGVRAESTTGAVSGYDLTTGTYTTVQHSMATYVSDEARDNADPGLDLDTQAVEYCMDKVLLGHEVAAAGVVFATGSYASGHYETLTGTGAGGQWSDGGSTPIEDVRAKRTLIAQKTGRRANTLVLGQSTYDTLADHGDIMDRIKYTQRGIVTVELLAALFDVERVLVGRAVKETAHEGDTASSMSFIWTDSAALLYVPPRPALRTPSFGYTFIWRGYNYVVERWRKSEGGNADGYRVLVQRDIKVTGNTCGYLWSDCVA